MFDVLASTVWAWCASSISIPSLRHGLRHLYILSTVFWGHACDFGTKFMLWIEIHALAFIPENFATFRSPKVTLRPTSLEFIFVLYILCDFFLFCAFFFDVFTLSWSILCLRFEIPTPPRREERSTTRNCFICPLAVYAFTSELVNFFIRISWNFQF